MCCEYVKVNMNDYLAMRMSEAETQTFESHLAGCADCRQLTEGMRVAVTTLQSLPQYSLDDRFESRLRDRLPKSISIWRRAADFWSQWILSPGNRWVTAGIGVGIAAALLVTPQFLVRTAVTPSVETSRSAFVMQCVEQHAAFTGDQTMPETLSLDRADESSH